MSKSILYKRIKARRAGIIYVSVARLEILSVIKILYWALAFPLILILVANNMIF